MKSDKFSLLSQLRTTIPPYLAHLVKFEQLTDSLPVPTVSLLQALQETPARGVESSVVILALTLGHEQHLQINISGQKSTMTAMGLYTLPRNP